MFCRICFELAGCVHHPIVSSESTIVGWGQTNLSQLYFSRLSLAIPAKLNFFKTPASVWLVLSPLQLEYQAASSQARLKSCWALPPWGRPTPSFATIPFSLSATLALVVGCSNLGLISSYRKASHDQCLFLYVCKCQQMKSGGGRGKGGRSSDCPILPYRNRSSDFIGRSFHKL